METGPKEVRELSERYERLETLISRVNVNSLREEHERQVRGKAVGVDCPAANCGRRKQRDKIGLKAYLTAQLAR